MGGSGPDVGATEDGSNEASGRILIVMFLELGCAMQALHRVGGHPIVPQSWQLEDGVRRPDEYFLRSYLCVQYLPCRTRVDDRASLSEFCAPVAAETNGNAPVCDEATPTNAVRAVLPAGLGGGTINVKQLRKEILYLVGVAPKYGA